MIGAIQNSEYTFFGKISKNKHFKYVPNFFPQIFSLANFFQIPGSGSKLGNTLNKAKKKKKRKKCEEKNQTTVYEACKDGGGFFRNVLFSPHTSQKKKMNKKVLEAKRKNKTMCSTGTIQKKGKNKAKFKSLAYVPFYPIYNNAHLALYKTSAAFFPFPLRRMRCR